jgi:hypothetical protein
MIHILKNKINEFYWITVAMQGGGFEEIGRDSESHPSKQGAIKNIKSNGKAFGTKSVKIIDHTTKVRKYLVANGTVINRKLSIATTKPTAITTDKRYFTKEELREIDFVHTYQFLQTGRD